MEKLFFDVNYRASYTPRYSDSVDDFGDVGQAIGYRAGTEIVGETKYWSVPVTEIAVPVKPEDMPLEFDGVPVAFRQWRWNNVRTEPILVAKMSDGTRKCVAAWNPSTLRWVDEDLPEKWTPREKDSTPLTPEQLEIAGIQKLDVTEDTDPAEIDALPLPHLPGDPVPIAQRRKEAKEKARHEAQAKREQERQERLAKQREENTPYLPFLEEAMTEFRQRKELLQTAGQYKGGMRTERYWTGEFSHYQELQQRVMEGDYDARSFVSSAIDRVHRLTDTMLKLPTQFAEPVDHSIFKVMTPEIMRERIEAGKTSFFDDQDEEVHAVEETPIQNDVVDLPENTEHSSAIDFQNEADKPQPITWEEAVAREKEKAMQKKKGKKK